MILCPGILEFQIILNDWLDIDLARKLVWVFLLDVMEIQWE